MEAQVTAAPAPARRRRSGRWAVIGLIGAFLALLTYGLLSKGADDTIDRALASGRAPRAPGFSLELLDRGRIPPGLAAEVGGAGADGRLSLRELRGVPVVLNLWASWCTPCRAEAPQLQAAWEREGRRGVAFLGLNIQDLRDDAREFGRRFRITYPSVRDPGRDTANEYGATGIPETYFIDRRGRVVGHAVGAVSEQQLRAGARAAAEGRVVGRTTGGARFPVRD